MNKMPKIKKTDVIVKRHTTIRGTLVSIFRSGKEVSSEIFSEKRLSKARKAGYKIIGGKTRTRFLTKLKLVLDKKTRRIRRDRRLK